MPWQTHVAVIICQCVYSTWVKTDWKNIAWLKNGSSLKSFYYLWTIRYITFPLRLSSELGRYSAAKIHMHFLEGTFKKAFFFDFQMSRARQEPHPDDIMPTQCTIHGTTTWHHFGFAKCSRSWDILEKNTYKQTRPEPVFHRLLDSGFAPSALSFRLNNLRTVQGIALKIFGVISSKSEM